MNKQTRVAFCISIVFAANTSFACNYPEQVLMPKGNTATGEEMLAGQSAVKQYVAGMSIYLECISEEEKNTKKAIGAMQPDAEQERKDKHDKKYKTAIADMENVAKKFNVEVQKFRKQASK